MANRIVTQRLVDSQKRALVKLVLISDGTQESNTTIIDVSTLNYALNANGYLMVSNTHPKSVYKTQIKKLYGIAKANGFYTLKWGGTANTEIVTLPTGYFSFDFDTEHAASITNPDTANSTGDILLSSLGLVNNDTITLFIDLKKDNSDFDAGQSVYPSDFNR